MTTHTHRLLVTMGVGLALIGTLALWPVKREAAPPPAKTAAPARCSRSPLSPPSPLSLSGTPATAEAPAAVADRYADCAVLDEQTGPADANGRYERMRVVRTTDKYPLVRVVERWQMGYGLRATGDGPQAADPAQQDAAAPDRLLSQMAMVADHVLVQVKEGTSEAELAAFAKANGGTMLRKLRVPGPGTYLVKMASVTVDTVPQAIASLGQAGGPAAAVHPDGIVYTCDTIPNDPRFAELWGMHNVSAVSTASTGPANVFVAGGSSDGSRLAYSPMTPPEGVMGLLYNCGLGKVGEFPAGVSGNVALIQRGGTGADGNPLTFAAKATNAKAAGAVAAVIYNNVAGGFSGTLGGAGDWIPTVGISDADGAQLLSLGNIMAIVTALPSSGDIDAPAAWDLTTGSSNVLVAVIDTGIDYTHEDLAPNMWTNPGETGTDVNGMDKRTNGIDDDGNGYVDDWHGWDFCNDDNDSMDDHFHGTHCAGTIGGVGNNGIGVAGVNWNVSLVGLKFLSGSGSGTFSDGTEAIYYATKIGAKLTSNSWGGGGYTSSISDPANPMRQAILDAGAHGVLFVVAAGNASWNNDDPEVTFFPATYDCANIIAVAATDSGDNLASFSDYGATTVDLGAPGVSILSCQPGNRYQYLSGTSMATPHVAGACALIASTAPAAWSAAEIKAHLLANTEPIPALKGKCVTGGRLNIGRAAISPTPLAKLTLSDVSDAAPGGNGDGLCNPGETVKATVSVANCSSIPLANVNLTVTGADPYVSVVDGAEAIGDLPALGSRETPDAFTLALAPNCPTPREVSLDVQITAASGGSWSGNIRFTVYTSSQIAGAVTLDGAPAAGVTIDYFGPTRGTRVTDANGAYMFGGVKGLYVVSARKTDWLNTAPAFVTVPPSTNSVNFAFTTATVSGRAAEALTGQPVAGATITYGDTLSGVVTTDADGRYSFTRVYGRAAMLKLTASHPAYFDATNSVTVPPNAVGVNFAMGNPNIAVDLTPLEVTATMGEVVTRTRTIGNEGIADLAWRINPSGRERRAVTLNVIGPLAFDGDTLWSADNKLDTGYLYKFDPLSGAWLGAVSVPDDCCAWDENHAWNGLDWDGANLWVAHWAWFSQNGQVHGGQAVIHAVNPATGTIVKTLRPNLPGLDLNYSLYSLPHGMTLGDGCLWLMAESGPGLNRVWKLDANTGAVLAHWQLPAEIACPHNSYLAQLWPAHEIEYVNGALYIASTPYDVFQDPAQYEGKARLYKLNPDTGEVLDSFTIPGIEVYGLARAGTRDLWLTALHASGNVGWVDAHLLELGDEPWMRENPRSGTLAYLGSQTVTLTLDTVPAGLGVHESKYRIVSNDPSKPELEIPVRFTVLPNPANRAPVIAEGASVSVTMSEESAPTPFALTLHASDPDGDPLVWSVAAPAAHGGALALAAGGSVAVEYSPAPDYFGADSFLVQVADNQGAVAIIAVNVTVQNVNDAPTLSAMASVTMGPAPLTVNFTATGTDVDGDTLSYAWDFGDGHTSSTSYSSHTYTNPGTYAIAVTVSDPGGLSQRKTLLVSATAGPARGLVYAWGWNIYGQIGIDMKDRSILAPTQVPGLTAARIIAGTLHSTAILNDGSILNWGSNQNGELGDGTFIHRYTPQPAPAFAGCTAIFADGSMTFVLKSGGAVWGCGRNDMGQLGDGTTADRCTLVQMTNPDGTPFTGVVAVAAGYSHALLLKADGTVWATGANWYGQLGNGAWSYDPTVHPVPVTKGDGSPLTGITAIGRTQRASFAIGGGDGRVWGWGDNTYGEVGRGASTFDPITSPEPVVREDGSPLTGVVALEGGYDHAVALRDDGSVWHWGANYNGQMADPVLNHFVVYAKPAPISSNVTAVAAGSYYTMTLKNDGTLWVWGRDIFGGGTGMGNAYLFSPVQLTSLAKVTSVSTHMAHTLVTVDPSANAVIAEVNKVIVPEGGTATFRVKLELAPTNDVTVAVRRTLGDEDLSIQSGNSLVFTPANWDTWQTVTLAAAEDDDATDGTANFTCEAPGLNGTGVMAREQDNDAFLTVLAAPGGAVFPDGSLVVTKGAATPIAATPDAGNVFVRWTVLSGAATFGDANAAITTVTLGNDAPAAWPGTQIRADFGSVSNRPPVISTPAWAGPNPTALPNGTTLHVAASDPDGDTLAYAWSKVSGPGAATFGAPTAANGGVTFGAAGTYVLRVTVDDNRGGTASSDVTVTVNAAGNNPPTILSPAWADANPVTLPAGTTVHVVASDPDGDPLTYAWSKVSGAGTATFAAPAAADSGVTFSTAGTYVLRVTASDGKGGSVASDVSETVIGNVDPRADLNHDGVVNALDLQIVIANFGQTVGSPGCDARADANSDGVVNALDLQIVIANFGKVVP